jgi:hypothetical protein
VAKARQVSKNIKTVSENELKGFMARSDRF